jgi:NAD(P)-dependent dehydrogenase (short-subunit alcohol dehydrogenase family)
MQGGDVTGMAPYAACKAALSHFIAELRLELAGLPIGMTLVELGPIPTQMLRDAKKHPATDAGFRRLYNLRLLVEVDPSTVAAAVVAAVRRGRSHVRLPPWRCCLACRGWPASWPT